MPLYRPPNSPYRPYFEPNPILPTITVETGSLNRIELERQGLRAETGSSYAISHGERFNTRKGDYVLVTETVSTLTGTYTHEVLKLDVGAGSSALVTVEPLEAPDYEAAARAHEETMRAGLEAAYASYAAIPLNPEPVAETAPWYDPNTFDSQYNVPETGPTFITWTPTAPEIAPLSETEVYWQPEYFASSVESETAYGPVNEDRQAYWEAVYG